MRILATIATLLLALLIAGCDLAAEEPSTPPPTPSPSPTLGPPPTTCPAEPDPGAVAGWDIAPQTPSVIPIVATMRLTCGLNRIVIGLLAPDNRSMAAPDRSLRARFFDLTADPETATDEAVGTFTWTIEGERGVYILSTEFAHAGAWGVEVITQPRGGAEETIRLRIDVATEIPTIRVGQKAPESDTPTAADFGGDIALLSTDDDPDPSFYDTSVADALGAKKPFVLAFATPKFCVSSTCGPALDRLKPFAKAYPSIDFINVEPYKLEPVDGQLQPVVGPDGELQPVASVEEWGLLTEPMVFVVDAQGTVRAAFEGAFGDDELRAALAAVDVPAD